MDKRIAIDLTGGGQQEAGVVRSSQPKTIVRPQGACFHGLDGEIEITRGRLGVRAGRRCKMQDRLYVSGDENVIRYIMLVERKSFIPHQVGDVSRVARDEIVQPDDFMPFRKKAVTQM